MAHFLRFIAPSRFLEYSSPVKCGTKVTFYALQYDSEYASEAAMTTVFVCRQEDGIFLAASIDSPRFCVGAATPDEAVAKAQRAFDYYQSAKAAVKTITPRETRVISPAFEERELVAR